jgi:membrane-associated phospholipid phosphatase
MDILGDFSLEVTRWLQENYPGLEPFFYTITQSGRFEFYMVALTVAYWCVHKQFGRALCYLLAFNYLINSFLKHLVRNQRPFWDDLSLALVEERGYGIPSGHSQIATVFYGLLAIFIRRGWAWIGAAILIFLMALSRIYLGVHDIEDVLAGILLGLLTLLGYWLWNRYLIARFNKRILGQRLLFALVVPIALVVLYGAGLLLLDPPDWPTEFSELVEVAELQSWEDSATAFGLLIGFSIGFVMEMSRVRFLIDGPLGRRALRYLVGMVGGLAIWLGLDAVFPSEPLALSVPLRILRYFLVALWVSYYAPLAFVRLRLADARPEPEVSLTL